MECKGDVGLGHREDSSALNPLGVKSSESPNVAGIAGWNCVRGCRSLRIIVKGSVFLVSYFAVSCMDNAITTTHLSRNAV